ncbi:uncharacterized protein PHALS_01215 [Plasmopara halstedii]|uniref:Uncharacterized protein n=1 Tax=Plasmopara halstedii TaxID=4781 RepID=A0A0P1AUA3_PLAHL|nr:uncharacterized protein PHALS_01215 [Plasmopara halstedii]CEG44885.1 hypothetical protein PHALS_01215 [Plasmopara halstedii]|eukprot:XP_024581254.1 hypothetical protein PHALS_01215 [Plasmopara halstedii]
MARGTRFGRGVVQLAYKKVEPKDSTLNVVQKSWMIIHLLFYLYHKSTCKE